MTTTTKPTTRDHLLSNVLHVVDRLEGNDEEDRIADQLAQEENTLFQDILDVRVECMLDGTFLGADVTFTLGGPTIWAETRRDTVVGVWGSDRIERSYDDNVGLEDYIQELWSARG